MEHQITVMLPDRVYEALRRWAKAQKKSVSKIAEETLCAAALSEEVPSSLDTALRALAEKSDEELWQIAESQLPPAKMRRLKRLINKHEFGDELTEREQKELEQLVEEETHLTVVKSEAYVLLKQRGHRIPTLEELQRGRRVRS